VRTIKKPSEPTELTAHTIPAANADRTPHRRWYFLVAAALIVVGLVCWLGFSMRASHSSDRRFLQPFLDSKKPIICISHPNAYNLSPHGPRGKGDAQEALRLRDHLLHLGRSSRIGLAQDITVEDLSSSPMIIVGGPRFNHWTATLTQDLRFAFDIVDNKPRIYDRFIPSRFWTDPEITTPQTGQGYVVITRLLPTEHRKAVLCVAGLRAVDTRAGTQVVSDTRALNDLLKNAPDDWAGKNLQWVLYVANRNQAQPQVELRAATYW